MRIEDVTPGMELVLGLPSGRFPSTRSAQRHCVDGVFGIVRVVRLAGPDGVIVQLAGRIQQGTLMPDGDPPVLLRPVADVAGRAGGEWYLPRRGLGSDVFRAVPLPGFREWLTRLAALRASRRAQRAANRALGATLERAFAKDGLSLTVEDGQALEDQPGVRVFLKPADVDWLLAVLEGRPTRSAQAQG